MHISVIILFISLDDSNHIRDGGIVDHRRDGGSAKNGKGGYHRMSWPDLPRYWQSSVYRTPPPDLDDSFFNA